MIIGILALQGAFIEHKYKLDQLNIKSFYIRNLDDLMKDKDGIIIPGGESTAMYKLLVDLHMDEQLKMQINHGLPVFGTCAGLILLAKRITNQAHSFLDVMDISVTRNGYGRQLSSFITQDLFNKKNIPMTFIRAPYIDSVGKHVTVLSIVDQKIVAARQNHILVTAFHPELTDSLTVHEYFLSMIKSYKK